MVCLFHHCNETSGSTIEHVLPEAIGGKLIIPDFCKCNSLLGHIDSILANDGAIEMLRQYFEIKNKGKSVNILKNLRSMEDYNQKADITSKYGIKFKPRQIRTNNSKTLIYDIKEKERLKKAVNVHRARKGLPYISDDEFERNSKIREVGINFLKNAKLNSPYIVLPLLKIAYEFAYLNLGKAYLEDDIGLLYARALREAFISKNYNKEIYVPYKLLATPLLKAEAPVLELLDGNPLDHVIQLIRYDNIIECIVKIFDAYICLFRITNNAEKYILKKNPLSYVEMIKYPNCNYQQFITTVLYELNEDGIY